VFRKIAPGIQLDLGGIAKGYGVDRVSECLDAAGLKNWFVEIGGEVRVRGLNPDGVPWKIGIQFPSTNPMDQRLWGIVHATNGAVATSGDYRNYILRGNRIYSHILDPRTGMTVFSETASVTVIAPTCMKADGIATALFVMGSEEGLEWIEQRPENEALVLTRCPDGGIAEKYSSGFIRQTGYSTVNSR
jgi:thiamine biosynthesis lipoprotein